MRTVPVDLDGCVVIKTPELMPGHIKVVNQRQPNGVDVLFFVFLILEVSNSDSPYRPKKIRAYDLEIQKEVDFYHDEHDTHWIMK